MKEWLIIVVPVVLIQLFVPFLEAQVALLILLGCFYAFFSTLEKVFFKALIAGAITPVIVYFLNADSNAFVGQILEQLGVSAVWGTILFIVFNALTAAFCFQIGYSLRAITLKKRR